MRGRLSGRRGERPDQFALPAPNTSTTGAYPLRALGDTRVLALIRAAESADWDGVKTALAPFDLGRDHQVLNELADLPGVQDWIGSAIEKDDEHQATALLISGARHVTWGWEARTDGLALKATRDQWRLFHERLEIGEEHLLLAAEARPEWITPWRCLLSSARGMSLDKELTETRFEAALRRDPLDLDVHLERVMSLQPRWGGRRGEALAYARRVYRRAPAGHRLGCVIAEAHIEDWVEASGGGRIVTRQVATELREAAKHSILHRDHQRRPGWQQDFNRFAMALSLARDRRMARRVFNELDGAYTRRPWCYFKHPEQQFARRQLL